MFDTNAYSILNALNEVVDELESDDYSARNTAIRSAISLANETRQTYRVRNDKTNFIWLITKDGKVQSLGKPKPHSESSQDG